MIPNKQKAILVMLLAFLLPSTAFAYAYDFCVDGIYYSRSGVNAAVTCYTTGANSYSGDVVIPSSVTYGGTTYAVTSISFSAFNDCKDLTSVTIPNTVTSIGYSAFKDCKSLMSVSIPNSVISIDAHAFEGCNGIISLNIGTSVTSVGDYAFKGCSGITSMTLPNSITTIGEYAFNACVGLTNVTVPNSVTTIGAGAFYGCTSLANINVPNSVMNIGLNAFDGTSWYNNQPDGLVYAGPVAYRYKGTMTDGTSINIKEGTLYIAEEAFKGCSGLLSINIPNSVTSIGDYAFSGCTSLSSLNVPNSVSFIGLDALDGTSWYNNQPDGLVYAGPVAYKYKGIMPDGTSISIKEGTLCITSLAFKGCNGMTSVTIPNSVTTIGNYAFQYCSGLTTVTIPNSVTSIGNCAFRGCTALETLNFNAASCDDFSWSDLSSPFYNLNISTINFGDSVQRIPRYFAYNLKKLTSVTIPNSVNTIGVSAFSCCSGLTEVNIGNSVTTIGGYVFRGCSGLTTVTIPSSVSSIGQNVFGECESLVSLMVESGNYVYDSRDNCNAIIESESHTLIAGCQNTIVPTTVTAIGDYAFYCCHGLTGFTIPNYVTSIGDYAFYRCIGLTGNLDLPNSITSIGGYAFSGCNGLTGVTIPNTVKFLGVSVFSYCNGLTNACINSTAIGIDSFYACGGLKRATIGTSVTFIGEFAFQGCSALDTLYFNAVSCEDFSSDNSLRPFANLNISTIFIGDSVERIPAFFAYYLTKLTNLSFGSSVSTIGKLAFNRCSNLTNIKLPNSVIVIDDGAFSVCGGLTSLTIPDSVTTIGVNAFNSCAGLTSITIGNSVQTIGSSAFSSCSSLSGSLTIPNSVTTIGSGAFSGCTALDTLFFNAVSCADSNYGPFYNLNISTIIFGNSVERIPSHIAWGLAKLSSVTIGSSVNSIADYAFWDCTSLDTLYFNAVSCADFNYGPFRNLNISTIIIGNDVERIPAFFAYGLTKLTSITIGNSVQTIGSSAFSSCSSLSGSLTIPNSVTLIGDYAFFGCIGFTNVTIGNSVTSIGNASFYGCSGLMCLTIPNSVNTIGGSAFNNCTSLTSINIGNSVTSIGNSAFSGCTALDTLFFNAISCADFSSTASYRPFNNLNISTINFGNDVVRIPAYFAYGLTKLTDLTMGTSITSIGNYSFYNCTKLASVTSLRPEAVSLPLNTFSNSTYSNATLTVPVGSYNSYKQTNYWNRFYGINESTSVDSIVLNFTDLSLYVGESVRLSAVIIPDDANQQVTWSTSNSSIVSVESDGTVTGMKVGTATVTSTTCDGSGRTASCLITVLANCKAYLDTLIHIRGEAAELVEVPISFYNRNAISAIQFDVSLPGCASFGYPVMWVDESRLTNSHSFSYNKLNDKSYRVLIASPSSAVLNGNDGPLVYLNVMLSKAVETAGDYYINISNIIAAEPDETRHALDNVKGVVRYYYIVGDVDADLSVDIADYMATASKILARSPSPFYSDAADVDENSSINVTDLVGITNISLGIKPITLRFVPRRGTGLDLLTCEPLVIAAGQERSITLNLKAGFDFAAFQMDLSLPQGLTLVEAELGGEASRLQLTWATLPDGNVRLLSSSFSDVEVQGDCPGLLTLKMKAEDDFGGYHSSIGLSNITFAERNLVSHEFDDMDVECYSSTAVSELDDATRIFVEEGHIIVETPVDGTVVVSDISGYIREYPVFAGHNEITPWCNGVMMIRYNNQTLKINLKR